MLDDASAIATDTPIEADICIIGGGAAGITVAREFIGTPHKVILLEGGGMEIDAATQDLYRGTNVGRSYYDLDACRLRYFGGSTNHWGGWCHPLSPIDFRKRPWIPHSGWPIDYDDLAPFYGRAGKVVQLPHSRFDEAHLLRTHPDTRAFPFDPAVLHPECYQFSPPTRFGEVYGPALKKAPNISVVLNANVVAIERDPDGSAIRSVRYATLGGKRRAVRAKTFILATGGIENARMLLASNIGNDHDLVGRFFMDHPEPIGGMVMLIDPRDPRWVPFVQSHPERADDRAPLGCVGISVARQAQERINNVRVGFHYLPVMHSEGMTALQQLLAREETTTALPQASVGENLLHIVSDVEGLSREAIDRVSHGKPMLQMIEVEVYGQQAPNPDSRVTLGDERDALGVPRLKMDWRLSDFDRHSADRTLRLLAQELGRIGLGRMKLAFKDWDPDFYYGNHHMGTTRMSDDPRTGVVDADCRVHGVPNLYVAGSSVFTTSGNATPTLTIVALALRLADHLKAKSA